MSTV
jgi:hypothetical protein